MSHASRQFTPNHLSDMPDLLTQLDCTLVLRATRGGRVVYVGGNRNGLVELSDTVARPVPMAPDEAKEMGESRQLRESSAPSPDPASGAVHFGGDLDLSDLAWGNDGLWAVNTPFSSLGLIDESHGFRSRWQPPFISDLTPGDRCHLNGAAMVAGAPLYATALGAANAPGGWRENRLKGGVLMHVPDREVVLHGLAMPCAPRLIDGGLFFLSAAAGELTAADPASGKCESVIGLSGFARGLCRWGDYLFVGLSSIRKEHLNGHMPVSGDRRPAGIAAVHLPSGRLACAVQNLIACDEIYEIQVLPGTVLPRVIAHSLVLDQYALAALKEGFGRSLSLSGWGEDAVRYLRELMARVRNGLDLSGRTLGRGAAAAALTGALVMGAAADGEAKAPPFTHQTGIFNPMAGGNPLYEINTGYYSAPVFVDIDGDGDLDAAVGTSSSGIRFFENTGRNTKPVMTERFGGDNPFNGINGINLEPAFVDIDNDGDFDMFVGEKGYSNSLRYFKNEGNASSPNFVQQTGAANPLDPVNVGSYPGHTPSFADIDGDGDMDAFIGDQNNAPYSIRYFENTGSPASPNFVERTGAANPLDYATLGDVYPGFAPTFADIDGDGVLDVVIGTNMGYLNYFRNDGNRFSPNFTHQTGGDNPFDGMRWDNYQYAAFPIFADIDGDGDMDLFLGNYKGQVRFFENTGNAGNPVFQEFGLFGEPAGVGPGYADIDGDGDFDAFLSDYFGNIRFAENIGNRRYPKFIERFGGDNPFDGVLDPYATLGFADINGDGRIDAFIGSTAGVIRYFENTGTPSSPVFEEQIGPGANPFDGFSFGNPAISLIDIDGDGDFDAFVGEKGTGYVRYFENTGNPTNPVFTERTGGNNPMDGFLGFSNSGNAFGDLDGDGDADAVIGEKNYSGLRYFENTGTPAGPKFKQLTGGDNPFDGVIVGYGYPIPALADIDGDGDLDVFVGEYKGRVHFFENETSHLPIPALGGWGMLALPFLLAGAGAMVIRRRRKE